MTPDARPVSAGRDERRVVSATRPRFPRRGTGRGASVEVGMGDADLGDVFAEHRDRGGRRSFLDSVPLVATAAAECDLARGAGVRDPACRPIAGDKPPLAIQFEHVDRRRVEAASLSPRHREDVPIGRSQAEPRKRPEERVDQPRCAAHLVGLGHPNPNTSCQAGRADGPRLSGLRARPYAGVASRSRGCIHGSSVLIHSHPNTRITSERTRPRTVRCVSASSDRLRMSRERCTSCPLSA
jgi:hypothetical protein